MTYTPSPTSQQLSQELGLPVSQIIKLDTGENPSSQTKYFSYPDPYCVALRLKLSQYTNLSPEYIACGNGSDELIDLLIRLLVKPNQEIIINPPTFPMYAFFANLSRAKVVPILRTVNLQINYSKILSSISLNTKLIFIDSPGNPAGTIIDPTQLTSLLEKRVPTVVDEAYFEYCGQTVAPLINKYPNLVVLRTFSKWAGLAGLRIGYVLANPSIIKGLLKIKPPYNVNSMAQKIACEVLDNKASYLSRLSNLLQTREILIDQLQKLTMQVYPSQSAYIVFKGPDPFKLERFLRQEGVIIKLINQPLLSNCVRISIPTKSQATKLLTLIKTFYNHKTRVCNSKRELMSIYPAILRSKTKYDGHMPKFDAVIFDIDGTLVDVSQSYTEAIRQTAESFLNRPVTSQEIAAVKSIPGYNNDWDTTFALISPSNPIPTFQTVKNKFQDLYLNKLINNERLLIKTSLLTKLAKKYKLGIATGRPRNEALLVLRKFQIFDLFQPSAIICLEDTTKSKPDPAPLLLCQQRLQATNPVYIGDNINDSLASQAASIKCVIVNAITVDSVIRSLI